MRKGAQIDDTQRQLRRVHCQLGVEMIVDQGDLHGVTTLDAGTQYFKQAWLNPS